MKICIVTDAWYPQVNGVVRTLDTVRSELTRLGHRVCMMTPDRFFTVPCPTYPEIRLALAGRRRIAAFFERTRPDTVHIATEGPLGYAARRWCLRSGAPFTTAYHTNFPDYIRLRTGIPEDWMYSLLRRFHQLSAGVLVAAPTVREQLAARGFDNLRPWTRGVDTATFRPARDDEDPCFTLPKPTALYVGRVAVEKNLKAFLRTETPGSKIVVGDGPALGELRAGFPTVHFLGRRAGEDLAEIYRAADVFVFPSRTDTFGLVMLEALASGVPVAAYPVQGPLDVIGIEGRGVIPGFDRPVGALDVDLDRAIGQALACDPADCRAHALQYSWENCARQFLANLMPVSAPEAAIAAYTASGSGRGGRSGAVM